MKKVINRVKPILVVLGIIVVGALAVWGLIYLKDIFLNGSSNTSNLIESNNSVKVTIDQNKSSDGNIAFNSFYEGFVLEKDIFELPQGAVLLNTKSEWDAFKNKYFSKSTDMNYSTLPPEDFTKQSIIYYSILGPLPSTFSENFQIDKIKILNNKLDITTRSSANTKVTVANSNSSIHRFVILAAVNKPDIKNVVVPNIQNTNNKWESIDRLRYVQGEIISLNKISNGKSILNLKVEKNYHDGTDPIGDEDFPFKRGTIAEFYINSQPEIDLTKIKSVIIYESDAAIDGNASILAASIKYYKIHGIFVDKDGKQISLPPTEYQNTL
ncbi:hypothetical protein [Candidatus Clostridium stratigraminis]|uniref:Uncharacterized protein n=1 Tax=Candidatus Clostridium stratigraminis TaxID=3381661 RepID=A0ABW8SYM0_9CLOT